MGPGILKYVIMFAPLAFVMVLSFGINRLSTGTAQLLMHDAKVGVTEIRVGDGTEGVVQGSVIGTYMHGPALARNPELADHLLATALGVESLAPLDLPEVDRLRRERLTAGRRR